MNIFPKINKDGFAISTMLYGLIFVTIAIFYLILALVANRQETNSNFVESVREELLDKSIVKKYEMTNMIKNSSFESGLSEWTTSSDIEIASIGYDGDKSLKFKVTNPDSDIVSMSQQVLDDTVPILGHLYYGALMFKSTSDFSTTDSRFEWIYNDNVGAKMVFAVKNVSTTDWIKLSNIQKIEVDTYLDKPWKIRNFQRKFNNDSYVDALILIDLTETFGVGHEPTKDWCDANINYFSEKAEIYK